MVFLLSLNISIDDIQQYISERLDNKAASATVNREVAVLRAILKQGLESNKISRMARFPAKLREANPRSGFTTDEEYAKLKAACKQPWLRALLTLAYNFGFRKGELLGLLVSQIDLKARTIRLLPGTTKNDKGRTVVMTAEIHGLLSECVRGKEASAHVFTWPSGKPVLDFRGSWDTLVEAAGMPDLLVHDLRRSAVRRMIRRGISKVVAKKISGHITDSVFDRYDIVDEQDLAEAAKKLEA